MAIINYCVMVDGSLNLFERVPLPRVTGSLTRKPGNALLSNTA